MNQDITRFRPELCPGVITLQRYLVSRHGDLNDAYFRCQHETNAYAREPKVCVAQAGGEVAGMRAPARNVPYRTCVESVEFADDSRTTRESARAMAGRRDHGQTP